MTLHRLLIICWLTIFASCGGDAVTAPDDRSDAAGAAFALNADPGEAVSVIDVKRSGPSYAMDLRTLGETPTPQLYPGHDYIHYS